MRIADGDGSIQRAQRPGRTALVQTLQFLGIELPGGLGGEFYTIAALRGEKNAPREGLVQKTTGARCAPRDAGLHAESSALNFLPLFSFIASLASRLRNYFLRHES